MADSKKGESGAVRAPRVQILPVSERWRIAMDPDQYMAQRRVGKAWRSVAWFRNLDSCGIYIIEQHIKATGLSKIPDGWIEGFQALMRQVDQARQAVVAAKVEHGRTATKQLERVLAASQAVLDHGEALVHGEHTYSVAVPIEDMHELREAMTGWRLA